MSGVNYTKRTLKDAYIARCVELENAVREKDREIERLNTELSDDDSDNGAFYAFGAAAAAIAGAIVGGGVVAVFFN